MDWLADCRCLRMRNSTEKPAFEKSASQPPHPAPDGPVEIPLAPPDIADGMVTGSEPERASERPHRPAGPSDDEIAEQSKEAGPQSEVGKDR